MGYVCFKQLGCRALSRGTSFAKISGKTKVVFFSVVFVITVYCNNTRDTHENIVL